jgi:formylglycine-generating enzyme required for sulfatase activity
VLQLAAACWLVSIASSRAVIPPQLALNRVNGLTVSGTANSTYIIQYSTNLAQANGWHTLTLITLSSNKAIVPSTVPTTTGARFYRALLTSMTAPSNMVLIQPGTFVMGSPLTEEDRFNDEGPQTTVTLTRPFFIGTRLVTQGDYLSVLGSNPSFFTGNTNLPVDQVSWTDANKYCSLLTQRELTAGRIPAGWKFRLPTEAEWEYTCRAGTTNRFYYGDDLDYTSLTNYAWFVDNSDGQTHPVGQKPSNPWGLYDMIGNVWQWCDDWYAPYAGGSVTDPESTDSTLGIRVLRGGSWDDDARACRSAYRSGDSPAARFSFYGFRIVLVLAD